MMEMRYGGIKSHSSWLGEYNGMAGQSELE